MTQKMICTFCLGFVCATTLVFFGLGYYPAALFQACFGILFFWLLKSEHPA